MELNLHHYITENQDLLFVVFNATFNNISVTLWQLDLLVEETGENH
jgi:hypothetical protein